MFKQRFKTSVEGSPQKLLFFHIIIRDIKFIDWVTKTAPKRVTADFWLALRNANSIKWWCSKTHKILGFQCTVLNVQHLLIVYLLLFDSPTTDLTVLLSSSRSIYCPLNALVRTLSFSSFRPGLKGLFAHSQGNPCVCEIHECPQIHKTSPFFIRRRGASSQSSPNTQQPEYHPSLAPRLFIFCSVKKKKLWA